LLLLLIFISLSFSKTNLSQFLKGQERAKGWSKVENVLSTWLDGRRSVPEEKEVIFMKEMIQPEDSVLTTIENENEVDPALAMTLFDPI
jgi:hypothetical protein